MSTPFLRLQHLSYSDEDSSLEAVEQGLGGQPTLAPEPIVENGFGLTFEQEQTADQLLADIQNAVDEMLQDLQTSTPPVHAKVPKPQTKRAPPPPIKAKPVSGPFTYMVISTKKK